MPSHFTSRSGAMPVADSTGMSSRKNTGDLRGAPDQCSRPRLAPAADHRHRTRVRAEKLPVDRMEIRQKTRLLVHVRSRHLLKSVEMVDASPSDGYQKRHHGFRAGAGAADSPSAP